MPFFDVLAPFDLAVLKFFNVTLAHPWLDQFWLTITRLHKFDVVRFGLFPALVIWLLWRYRAHGLKPILVAAVSVAICDGLSYRVIKSRVGRPRPFDAPAVASWVRPIGKAHGSSFPSNHAANVSAAAGVLAWYFWRARNLFYAFAILVSLSRIALGVHYPTDVLAGMVIGSTTAFLINALIVSRRKWLWLPVAGVPRFGANGRIPGRLSRT